MLTLIPGFGVIGVYMEFFFKRVLNMDVGHTMISLEKRKEQHDGRKGNHNNIYWR